MCIEKRRDARHQPEVTRRLGKREKPSGSSLRGGYRPATAAPIANRRHHRGDFQKSENIDGLDQGSVSGNALEKVGIADDFHIAGRLFDEGPEFLVELAG